MSESVLDRVVKNGVMKIAVMFTRPPKEGLSDEYYIDPDTGKPAGIVIEYMEMMCKDLGVKPEYIDMHWSKQVDALLNDEVDILPKHSNIPKRALQVGFAGRTINFDVVALINKDHPETMESLQQEGKVIACTKGSSNREVIEKYFPKAKIYEITEYIQGADRLKDKTVDAWVEAPVAKTLFDVRPELDVIRNADGSLLKLAVEYAHPGVKPGDHIFINWINNWLLYRDATGDLPEMMARWNECLIK